MEIKIDVPEEVVKAIKGIATEIPDSLILEALELGVYEQAFENNKNTSAGDAVIKWLADVRFHIRSTELMNQLMDYASAALSAKNGGENGIDA